jgi:hypothetical protein
MSAKTAKKMRKIVDLKNTEKEDLRVRPNLPLVEGKVTSTYTMMNLDPAKRKYKEIKKILKNKDLYDLHMKKAAEKENE